MFLIGRIISVYRYTMLVTEIILLLTALSTVSARQLPLTKAAADDLVVDLPGIGIIADGYSQYSGYLDGGDGAMLHYWYVPKRRSALNMLR